MSFNIGDLVRVKSYDKVNLVNCELLEDITGRIFKVEWISTLPGLKVLAACGPLKAYDPSQKRNVYYFNWIFSPEQLELAFHV